MQILGEVQVLQKANKLIFQDKRLIPDSDESEYQ